MTTSDLPPATYKRVGFTSRLIRLWNRLTEPSASLSPAQRQQARLLAGALIAIIVLVSFALIPLYALDADLYLILGSLTLAAFLIAYGFTRTPYPMIGGGIALGVFAVTPYIAAVIDPNRLFVLLFLLDSTLLSILLFRMRITGIVVIVLLAAMCAFPLVQPKADTITLLLVITCFALGSVLAMSIQAIRRQEQQQQERQTQVIADSELRYRLLAENATDLICRHQLDGTYLYVSPASRTLLGYEPEELIGTSPYPYFHPDDAPLTRLSHKKILASPEPDVVSYRFRCKDGDYIWFETNSKVIRDPNTGAPWEIITVSRDVTERNLAEDAVLQTNMRLEVSRDTLQRLVEQMPIGIQMFDTDGLCTSVNETQMTIFGLHGRHQVVGKFNILTDALAEKVGTQAGYRRALSGEVAHVGEVEFDFTLADPRFITTTGRRFLSVSFFPIYDENQAIVSVVALNQDITERALAEEALQKLADEVLQQKNTLNAVLTATPDQLAVFDPEGRYLYINPPGLAAIGVILEAIQGNTWRVLDTPTVIGERFDRERAQVVATGQPFSGTTQFPSVYGIREYEYTYSPIFDGEGKVVLLVSTHHDVTEAREAEQERFELVLQREQVKMLQHLISDTSHDLKTPLATLNTNLYLLKKSISDPERREHYAAVLQAQVINLTKILQDMDSMARLDSLSEQFVFEPLDLNAFVRQIITEHEARVRAAASG